MSIETIVINFKDWDEQNEVEYRLQWSVIEHDTTEFWTCFDGSKLTSQDIHKLGYLLEEKGNENY